ILSQNEIEVLGLQAAGRLRLIDGFAIRGNGTSSDNASSASEELLLPQVRSQTSHLQSLGHEIGELDSQLIQLQPALDQLANAQKVEASMAASAEAAKTSHAMLDKLGTDVAISSVKTETFKRASQWLRQFKEKAEALVSPRPQLAPWPTSAGTL